MPFGLRNATETFQRFINHVTCDLPLVYAYIDDPLVASHTSQEYEHHLRLLFRRLVDYELLINVKKCVFGVSELVFLGHVITPPRNSSTYL